MVRQIIPRFIAFEGLDGSGTTTQAKRLVERLEQAGAAAVYTYEPSAFLPGATIRRLLAREEPVHPTTMAFLYAADRNEHLFRDKTGVVALLERGKSVVTDRYLFSSLAYQGSEADREFVRTLNERFPLPEHLVYLDVDPDTAIRRTVQRGEADIYENLNVQRRVAAAYEAVLDEFSGSGMAVHRIDGNAGQDEVFASIWRAIGG